MRKRLAGFALASLALAGSAAAHHGWGSYDAGRVLKITAPVEHLEWANPHAHVMLKHEGATWEATLAPLFRMESRGLTQDMLKPGTPVTLEGYPSTRNPTEMRAERIVVGGKTVELR